MSVLLQAMQVDHRPAVVLHLAARRQLLAAVSQGRPSHWRRHHFWKAVAPAPPPPPQLLLLQQLLAQQPRMVQDLLHSGTSCCDCQPALLSQRLLAATEWVADRALQLWGAIMVPVRP